MAVNELNNTILKNSSSLKAYYRFESGALTTDSSGNGKTLTTQTGTETAGKFGGGIEYTGGKTSGLSDNLGIAGNGNITMSCWVKLSSEIGASLYGFLGHHSTTTQSRELILYYEYNGGTRRIVVEAGLGYIYYNIALGTSNWYHLVAVRDNTNNICRLYINGSHVGSVAPGSNASTGDNFFIGTFDGSLFPMAGYIDDVAIFNTALTADQIKELYEGRYVGEGWPQSGLVAGYHLNGSSTDFSGNNNHGTDTAVTYSQANGKFNQGGGFVGASSSKIVFGATIIPIGAKTIALWAKTASSVDQTFISNLSFNTGYGDGLDTTGTKLRYNIYRTAGTTNLVGNKVITDGAWHFLVATYDTSLAKIYVDGVLDNTSASIVDAGARANNLQFGIEPSNFNKLTGAIDEVQIYNVAKDANWVRQQYAWGMGRLI